MAQQPPFSQFDSKGGNASRGGGWSCLAVGMIVAGALFVVCLLVAVIIVRVADSVSKANPATAQKRPPATQARSKTRSASTVPRETREERQTRLRELAAIRAGFSASDVGVDANTLAEVGKVLDAFVEASKSQPRRSLGPAEFDANLYLREMYASPLGSRLQDYDRRDLLRQARTDVQVPHGWIGHRIVCVTPAENNGESLVYAHLLQDGDYSNPMRFWIIRNGATWKLFDWEQTEFGLRESHRWTIETVCDVPDEYQQMKREVDQANGLIGENKHEEAKRLLDAAAARKFEHPRHDEWQLRLAYAWIYGGWRDEAIVACHAVRKRDRLPSFYFVEAQAQAALGRRLKALALLDRCDQLLGPLPQPGAERLSILEGLRRYDDAVKQCQRQLALRPESMETMKQLGRLLAENQKQVLADHVAKLDKPLPAAVELAEMFADYGDAEGLAVMVKLVRTLDPAQASLPQLEARGALLEGRYEQAAPALLALLKKDSDKEHRQGLLWKYLDCMTAADKAIEGYESVPDADAEAAFMYLSGGDEDEGTLEPDQLARLVELHRRRAPQDPWGGYHAALKLNSQGKYDAALDELQKAAALVKKAEGEEKDEETGAAQSIRYQQISTLQAAGQGLKAYDTIPPADETFRTLAAMMHNNEAPAEPLLELIARHRVVRPQDPWLDYYMAVAEMRRQRWPQAERLLRTCYSAQPDDAGRKSQARYLWLECRFKQGRMADAWRGGLGPEDEAFVSIANRLENEEDWPKMRECLDGYGRAHPGEPQVIFWTARWCEGAKNDGKLLELLDPWPAAAEKLNATQKSALKQQLVRAYYRLGKKDAAWALARKLADDEEILLPLIFVSAAEGEINQAIDSMSRQDAQLYSRSGMYSDEALGPILRGPKFLPLREQFPPDLPHSWPHSQSMLLLSALPNDAAAQCEPVLKQFLGPQTVLREIKDAPGVAFAVLASSPQGRVLLTGGSGRYHNPQYASDAQLKQENLRAALNQHQAWLAIDVLEPEAELDATKLCGRVTAALMEGKLISSDCRAVSWENRLALADDATRKRLGSGPWDAQSMESFGERLWLQRDEPTSPADRQWDVQRWRSLKRLDSKVTAARAGDAFFVQAYLPLGHVSLRPWLRVLRVQNSGRRERSFVCTMQTASDLYPNLAPGEPVVVRGYEIRDWKHTSGGQTEFGRTAMSK